MDNMLAGNLRIIKSLYAKSLADLLSSGKTIETIIDEITNLDFATMSGLDSKLSGNPHQWKSIFEKYGDSISFVTDSTSMIVGYWHFLALKEDFFKKVLNGEMEDEEITVRTVQPFHAPGSYDVYFVGVAIHDQHRGYRINRILYASFLKILNDLSRRNMHIRSLCANVLTEKGAVLSETLGLKPLRAHKRRGNIYLKINQIDNENAVSPTKQDSLALGI